MEQTPLRKFGSSIAFHRPHFRSGDLAGTGFALQHNFPAPGGLRLYPPIILPLTPQVLITRKGQLKDAGHSRPAQQFDSLTT